jgi:hypothetical protein
MLVEAYLYVSQKEIMNDKRKQVEGFPGNSCYLFKKSFLKSSLEILLRS